MPEGVVVFREAPPATGTWSPRPPALAGITPKAVLIYGIFGVNALDGVNSAGACFFCGFSDGTKSKGIANYQADALASSAVRVGNTGEGLCYAVDASTAVLLQLGACTFVSGGMNVPVTVNANTPNVSCVFFYGDDWQAHCDTVRTSADLNGVVTELTGFTGTNENQLIFTLPCISGTCIAGTTQSGAAVNFGFGAAARQGASIVPVGQSAWGGGPRHNWSSAQIGQSFESAMVHSPATRASKLSPAECTRIADNEIDFTTREAISPRGLYLLAISTGASKCWAGKIDPLTASGNWIVNDPGFPPIVAGIAVHQGRVSGAFEESDIAIGGMAAGTASDEFSAVWSDEDGAGTIVAKSRVNSQFLDVIQDNGADGWKSGANDFSLTSLGFRVDNVTVSAGAPATQRAWIGWAIEGGAPGPVTLNTDDLLHAHPVDVANIIPSTYRLFGEDLVHDQPVGSISLNRIISLAANGLLHAQPVGSANVFAQSNPVLNIDSLIHAQPVESSYFGRYLRADDLLHTNALGQAEVTVNKGLTTDDLIHAQPVGSVGLTGSPDFVLNAQNLLHQQPVAPATLPKQTTLLAQGLVHGQPVDSVDLLVGGQTYPYINAQQGMLVFTWKPRYSKADMTTPPDVLALVGLSASEDALFRLFYGATSALQSLDGTSTVSVNLDAGAGPREGIAYRCALRWSSTPVRQVGYLAEDAGGVWVWGTEGSYDGKFGEGALRVFYNNQYPQLVSDILIYNQDAGREFIEGLPREF